MGKGSSRKTVSRRDARASRKLELGRYFSSIDWSLFNCADSCLAKLSLFVDTIHIGMDHIMPVDHYKIHVNDAPCITAELKNLIKLYQQAFKNGDKESYCLYRNSVNRGRKSLRSKYFAAKALTVVECCQMGCRNGFLFQFGQPSLQFTPGRRTQ